MPPEISAEQLFSVLKEERGTGELLPLPEDFYTRVKEELLGSSWQRGGEVTLKQVDNAENMLASLRGRRRQKLLIYLAYSKPLPQPIPKEETALYNQLSQVLSSGHNNVRVTRLKILADVPELITARGERIGPFKKGEVVEATQSSEIEYMLKNSIAALNE